MRANRRIWFWLALLQTFGCSNADLFESDLSHTKDGPVQRLSQSSLYDDITTHTINTRNRYFQPNFELWSDGAAKQRWLQLPDDGAIDTTNPDHWSFPAGTIVWKEFSFLGKRIETRMLEKVDDNTVMGPDAWIISTFRWNDDETDALRVNHGLVDAAPTSFGTFHDIPSVADGECQSCHDNGGDMLLGVSAIQLAGHETEHGLRLSDLNHENRLSPPIETEPMIPGNDVTQQLYGDLHVSCANCHNAESHNTAARDTGLFFNVPFTSTTETALPVWQTAVHTLTRTYTVPGRTRGVDSYNIEPGSPTTSAISLRMHTRGDLDIQMPPLATKVVHQALVDQVDAWILNLASSSSEKAAQAAYHK